MCVYIYTHTHKTIMLIIILLSSSLMGIYVVSLGTEAMFADLGHFTALSIRVSFALRPSEYYAAEYIDMRLGQSNSIMSGGGAYILYSPFDSTH